MTKKKIVTYQADFYHNGHSKQRDEFLIEQFGYEWLKNMKEKGHFGGDWPDEKIGQPKEGKSGYIDENGDVQVATEEVFLNSLEDLEKK